MLVTINLSDLHYIENLIDKNIIDNSKTVIEGIDYETKDEENYNILSINANIMPNFSKKQEIDCNCENKNIVLFEDMYVQEVSSNDDTLYLELRKDLECNCSVVFKTTVDRKQFDRILDTLFEDESLLEVSNRLIYLDEDFEYYIG